jgi:S-adenosylmethionine synthetase
MAGGYAMYIAESVTSRHPDKICDIVSDAIVDACLNQDSFSRVAVETTGGHGTLVLIGEVTTKAVVDFSTIAKQTYRELTGKDIGVLTNIAKQSPEISKKVDTGGAGDQGMMIGYACNENEMCMPKEMYLSRKLLEGYDTDGKSQVVCTDRLVCNTVLSVQGKSQAELEDKVKKTIPECLEMYCNNIGSFEVGGFDSDSGCTGRKIVVDAYGSRVPVGGGAFSGKDPSKVDRTGAYMARWVAIQLLHRHGAKEVLVKLGYVIGKAEPLLKEAYIDGKIINVDYDCTPEAIIERFDLRRPIYKDTAINGHFGRSLIWEL